MAFDVASFAFLVGVVGLLVVLILWLHTRLVPSFEGPRWWTAGMTLVALSRLMVLARTRPELDAIGAVVSYILFLGGMQLLLAGLLRFSGRPVPVRALAAAWLAGTLVVTVVVGQDRGLAAYQVAVSVTWAVGATVCAVAAVRGANVHQRAGAHLVAGSLLAFAAFHALRIPFIVAGGLPASSSFESSPWTLGTQVATLIVLVLVANGLVLMADQRLAAELRARGAQLAEANATLEDRVEQRTAALEASVRELETVSYSISHDLKGPLRAINGFASLLRRDTAGRLEPQDRARLESIVGASDAMAGLIERLLAYTHLARVSLHTVRVPLDPIVRAVVAHHRDDPTAPATDVQVVEPLAAVLGDPELVELVVRVLIENALTYHAEGEAPHVTVSTVKADGSVTLAVTDRGIGIAPEHQEQIFEVFTRLHPVDRYPGYGIGLSTARRAAALMDARIAVSSIPGEGSTFTVVWPAG